MKPILSVIVPVYNVEKYLRDCLESILKQSFKDFELIIVNDCSTDNSESIINEYEEKDPRVFCIKHTENKGLGAARNTGMRHANGKYVSFIDSDDFISKDLYKYAINAFNDEKVKLVFLPVLVYYENGKTPEFIENPYRNDEFSLDLSNKNLLRTVSACQKIYRMKDIKYIKFPEGLYYEDQPYYLEYFYNNRNPWVKVLTNNCFYGYRKSEGTITSRKSETSVQVPLTFIDLIKRTDILSNSFMIKCINKFIHNAYRRLDEKYHKEFFKNLNYLKEETGFSFIWDKDENYYE